MSNSVPSARTAHRHERRPGLAIVLALAQLSTTLVILVCAGACTGTALHGDTPAPPDNELWDLARAADQQTRAYSRGLEAAATELAAAVKNGTEPAVQSPVATTFKAARTKLLDTEAKLTAALADAGPTSRGARVENALVKVAAIYRRAQGFERRTTILAWRDRLACQLDVATNHLLLDHFQALVQGRYAHAAIYLARIDGALRCLSVDQVLLADAQLAYAIESAAAGLGEDERRSLRAYLLPALLVLLDVSKGISPTPLMQHLSAGLSEYYAPFAVPGGVLASFGVWLHDDTLGRLARFSTFCDLGGGAGCLHGVGLLQSLTDPNSLGFGECSAYSMVTSGATQAGGYACTRGMCYAAAEPASSPGVMLPGGISRAKAAGQTPHGVSLAQGEEASGACARGGAGGDGGRGGPTASPTACAIAAMMEDRGTNMVTCAAAAVMDAKQRSFQIPKLSTGRVDVPPGCMLSQEDPNATPPPSNTDADNEMKRTLATKLRDPVGHQYIQQAIAKAYGVYVSIQEVAAACEAAAQSLEKANVERDGQAHIAKGDIVGTADPVTGKIWVDGDSVDRAYPTAGGSLGGVLWHEAFHVVMYNLGSTGGEDGKFHHDGIISLLGCKSASLQGCNKLCAADEGCATSCTPQSKLASDMMGCFTATQRPGGEMSVGGQPGAVDPNPLDPPAPSSALMKCFTGLQRPVTGSPECLAVDCGDRGRATVNAAGVCVCSGGVAGSLTPGGGAACLAMRCTGGVPSRGPLGCSCAPSSGGIIPGRPWR